MVRKVSVYSLTVVSQLLFDAATQQKAFEPVPLAKIIASCEGRYESRWSCLSLPVESPRIEPIRLCHHPSIRTLLVAIFRSVPVGRSRFTRCCYLRIDLGFPAYVGKLGRELAVVT